MHSFILVVLNLVAVGCLFTAAPALGQPSPDWVYVAGSDAISLFRLDALSGTLEAHGVAAPTGAGFFAFSPDGRFAYATATETAELHKRIGEVIAFSVDRDSGKLTKLNEQPSAGDGPCFVTVDPSGTNVLVSNYSSATVAVLPVAPDGSLRAASCVIKQTGSSVDGARQSHAYAHSVNLDHAGKFAFVADLGADKLFIYRFDAHAGTLAPADPPAATLPPGSGPRHLAFDPTGRFAYLINEMGGTIAAYSYDAQHGKLREIQLIATLPADFKGSNTSAEVQLDPSGRFLYASNRGDTDFITIFAVDRASGQLSLIGYQPSLGKTPRNFRIDPTGQFLIVANQNSNSIVLFTIDPSTGKLTPRGRPLAASSPTCVKFFP